MGLFRKTEALPINGATSSVNIVNFGFIQDDQDFSQTDYTRHQETRQESSESNIPQIVSNPVVDDYSNARKLPQIGAALAASFGGFCAGSLLGWSSSVQPQLQRNATADDDLASIWYLHLTVDEMSWISSLFNIGALCGSLCGGSLMDKFGRRILLMASSLPYIISWLLIILAIHPSMLYVGRFIGGFAAGLCSVAGPSYIGEIATPNMRGVVGMFFSMNLTSGVLFTSLLVWLEWRWISVICAVQPAFLFIALFFMPESPYHQMKQGRDVDARKSLLWLRGSIFNAESEINQLKNRLANQPTIQMSDILHPSVYKPVVLAMTIMILQQFSGFVTALFYTVEIFNAAGSSLDPRLCSIIAKAVMLAMTILASTLLVQCMKRRTLFIVSEVISATSMMVLGGYFFIRDNNKDLAAKLGWLPMVSFVGFIAGIGMGLSPLSWLVSNEILPQRFKGPGSSIVSFIYWISAFVVTKTFVDLVRVVTTAGTFWFYGCVCAIGILFGIFFMPETKGKTPAQIEAIFYNNPQK